MTVIERKCCLVVGHQLVEVLVDLGQLGRELLVIEGVAFLVEELGHRDDQHQPLLGLHLGEADRLAGGELLGEARGTPPPTSSLYRGPNDRSWKHIFSFVSR